MKKSPETFTAICDLLCVPLPYAEICRRLGLSQPMPFIWINQCRREKKEDERNKVEIEFSKSIFVFEYAGVVDWYSNHVRTAMRAAVLSLSAKAMSDAHGTIEPVYFQGQPTWQVDEKLVGLDAETLAILGLPDHFKRDQHGNRIQNVIVRPGSPQLVAFMLKSLGGRAFADKRSVDHTGNLSVGVSVLADRPPSRIAAPAAPAAQIAQQVAAEIIEPVIEDAEFTEVEQPEPDAEATEQPEPDAEATEQPAETMAADEPAADEAPALDALAASRAERARLLNAQAAAAVRNPRPGAPAPARPPTTVRPPVHATSAYQPDDEKMECIGAGIVVPGGVKVK